MSSDSISKKLNDHYTRTFADFGPSSRGVDWGDDPADHALRLDRMLAVHLPQIAFQGHPSILDVGCGYGSLYERMEALGLKYRYHGIDICAPMIDSAREKHPDPEWTVGDILEMDIGSRYDFVVCNGILTQKLNATISEMDAFARRLVTRMYDLCTVGVAFNIMTTHVNFMVPNLFYRNPVEFLAWCMLELSPHVRLDHAYPLFEYTLYLYRHDCSAFSYGAHRSETRNWII